MNIKRALSLPVAALAAVAAGLTLGALTQGVEPPTPAALTASWDCASDGNRICDVLTAEQEATAWQTFEDVCGVCKLKVDPSREFRVELLGYGTVHPALGMHDIALPAADGKWYAFRAVHNS